MIGPIGKIATQARAGHRVAPQKPEPLLAEAGDHRDKRQGGENGNIDKSLANEAGHIAIGDRGHKIAADIAVDDVERIRRAEEQDQRGEDDLGLPANFGLRKNS